MTNSSASMSWLIRERKLLANVENPPASVPTPGDDADARRLASAIARGDEAAFQRLYDRYHDRLFRFAIVFSRGDESLARDVVQSVFVIAAAKLRRIESEAHLWNWLARIARQQIAKTVKRDANAPLLGIAELPERADLTEADTALEQNLDAALLALEPDEREVVEWFYFDGLSQKEIAERLQTTPKAVSSRLERARAKLRALVKRKLCDEF